MGKKLDFPPPIRALIDQVKRLPGIGPRSAERIALWIHRQPSEYSESLTQELGRVREHVGACVRCGFFTSESVCALCSDVERERSPVLCVVEQSTDVLPLEETGAFSGAYHVLGGRLSPLNHIGPDQLLLEQLMRRIGEGVVEEVILALSNDVEGEATANYIAELLDKVDVRVTRLAQGLPAGGGLDGADQLTLIHALNRRQDWE